ncbi:hypothetical protein FVEN_g7817 [Fusarium venenatum]|uniref:Uncharacterized protein n=2 Tax=Fusarium venenatum TaxID=56646 RepID=A0A2L2TIP9_9HYPO|nr:uncharacterized protein FVRRES_07980 [Fusarium venenatum]KAG8354234.1 hypothetical protein FVEN_g7817 [Fusarium venenatum]CEI67903.1 unnamed protein product [Fusarium venenatum]
MKEPGTSSIHAGAGSLDHGQGSARVVQVIHESVRWFFIGSGGFALLDTTLTDYLASCHLAIAATCLDYIHIPELDDLVTARHGLEIKSSVSSSGLSSAINQHRKFNALEGNSLQSMPALGSLQIVESWMFVGFPTSNPPSVVELPHKHYKTIRHYLYTLYTSYAITSWKLSTQKAP